MTRIKVEHDDLSGKVEHSKRVTFEPVVWGSEPQSRTEEETKPVRRMTLTDGDRSASVTYAGVFKDYVLVVDHHTSPELARALVARLEGQPHDQPSLSDWRFWEAKSQWVRGDGHVVPVPEGVDPFGNSILRELEQAERDFPALT